MRRKKGEILLGQKMKFPPESKMKIFHSGRVRG